MDVKGAGTQAWGLRRQKRPFSSATRMRLTTYSTLPAALPPPRSEHSPAARSCRLDTSPRPVNSNKAPLSVRMCEARRQCTSAVERGAEFPRVSWEQAIDTLMCQPGTGARASQSVGRSTPRPASGTGSGQSGCWTEPVRPRRTSDQRQGRDAAANTIERVRYHRSHCMYPGR